MQVWECLYIAVDEMKSLVINIRNIEISKYFRTDLHRSKYGYIFLMDYKMPLFYSAVLKPKEK